MSQWYFNPVGGYGLVALLAALLLASLTLLGPSRVRVSPARRWMLFGLRLCVLLLTVFALLRPVLVHTETKKQSATLVILADKSRSMQVADSFGGKSRWDVLQSTLADAWPALRELSADLEIKLYTFDADLRSVDFSPEEQPNWGSTADGVQTAIGAALDDVLKREAGKRLSGVVLLTDGAQRAYAPRDAAPQTPARRLADLGYPLYGLTFGQSRGLGQARDVAIKEMTVNQTVFVKNQLTVFGSVRIDGYPNQEVPVQLLFESPSGKMEVVASKTLRADKQGEALPIEMTYVPQTPGEYKVTLRVAKRPGELVTTNNELSSFVTVLKGGLSALYVEGSLRVEQKFLRRSLDASPDIKVDYIRLAELNPDERAEDLTDKFRKGKYDVYILGDIDSAAFTRPELQALAKRVRDGAGLIMLGGFHTFGPGGYHETPLAALLPLKMEALERQRYGEKIRADMHWPGPLKMRPATPLGIRHFVMALAGSAADNTAAWEKLPPLEGANKLEHLKPTAQVLAESQSGEPLLVATEAGGRVMAFAGDSTWHWWMEGHEAAHKRFWRQIVLWLARKDQQNDGNVWVKLEQRRYAPGSRVDFTAGAHTPQGEPATDAAFEADITLPDGTHQSVHLSRQGELMAGSFSPALAPGDYTIAVTATQNGEALGTGKSRFLVFEQDLELDNAVADPTLVASLAKMTEQAGGQSLAPEELPDLLKRIREQPLELEVETQVKESPWDTWPFFALFVGLLSVEWYLRKKWGLV